MIPEKVTDACTAGAVCMFGVHLAAVNEVVQIIAGALTAIAASISIYGAGTRWIARRRG